jgi:glyoxylase-like metal-dependent hydrolase (beta-lactamase superfamily II)
VRAVDPAHRLGDEGLPPGAVVDDGGCVIEVIATPGHTADSVSLYLPADGAVMTGDTVLGRGTTVIADDGNLADYLARLTGYARSPMRRRCGRFCLATARYSAIRPQFLTFT